MSADRVLRQLLETDDPDGPLGMNPLEPYVGPIEFNNNIKDIIEHARYLKQQAEQAGAVDLLTRYQPVDIDRAFLMIAVEQYDDELKMPGVVARILKRTMHSIWD